MARTPLNLIRWLFDRDSGPRNRFAPRWIFLRALAGIYFSAFLALFFQIRGLIGPQGILPAAGAGGAAILVCADTVLVLF